MDSAQDEYHEMSSNGKSSQLVSSSRRFKLATGLVGFSCLVLFCIVAGSSDGKIGAATNLYGLPRSQSGLLQSRPPLVPLRTSPQHMPGSPSSPWGGNRPLNTLQGRQWSGVARNFDDESMTDAYARVRESRAKAAARERKENAKREAEEKGGLTALFSRVTGALDFQEDIKADRGLLRSASKLQKGDQLSQDEYGALKRKVGGTKGGFFGETIEVEGKYTEKGYVAADSTDVLSRLTGLLDFGGAARKKKEEEARKAAEEKARLEEEERRKKQWWNLR